MLDHSTLVYFDIETAGIAASFNDLTPQFQSAWAKKCEGFKEDRSVEDHWLAKCALYPEFAQVVCMTVGYFEHETEMPVIETVVGASEHEVLALAYKYPQSLLSGWNIIRFDIPFVSRRVLRFNWSIPENFRTFGVKPWDMQVVDLQQVWECGRGSWASQEAVAACLGISQKPVIDGSETHALFWSGGHAGVKEKCEQDVLTSMEIAKRIGGLI